MNVRRGFTLIELTVWSFLSLLFLVALGAVFVTGRRAYEGASGSYMIGQEIESGIRFLRQDLQETALMSVRVYPNGTGDTAPGVSMISARGVDDPNRFHVSRYGAPEWDKHIFYVLEPTGDQTANLVRWEKADAPKSALPIAATLLPAEAVGNKRVILRSLLRPKVQIQGVGESGVYDSDPQYGGFRVSFVRQEGAADEELTPWNPCQVATDEDGGTVKLRKGTTRVLEVRLAGLMSTLGGGKPSMYAVHFRVSPRH